MYEIQPRKLVIDKSRLDGFHLFNMSYRRPNTQDWEYFCLGRSTVDHIVGSNVLDTSNVIRT